MATERNVSGVEPAAAAETSLGPDGNVLALIAHVFTPISGILVYLLEDDNEFARFDLLLRVNAEESNHGISGRAKRPVGFKTHAFQASPAGFQHRPQKSSISGVRTNRYAIR